MTRLFTFGCSFTNYRWSTWANCLAPEFDYFENWGQSGGGNHFIFNSLMEADQRHNFQSGDTVLVCWTSWFREDRYVKDRWVTLGNMPHTPLFVKSFIDQYVDERGCLVRDLAMVKAAHALLTAKPDVNWHFMSMCDITKDDLWGDTDTAHTDIVNVYRPIIDSILPSFQAVLRPLGWGGPSPDWIKTRNNDPHPNPQEHLDYLDRVLPGWVTQSETRIKIAEETALLEQNLYNIQNHRPRRSGLSTVQRL